MTDPSTRHGRSPENLSPGQDTASAKEDQNTHDPSGGDRWIWGVWLIIAVIAIGILPLTTRGLEMARAIASFCGFPI